MAHTTIFDTTVSREGRVVVPAAVRQVLGIVPGDRVTFLVDDTGVRLVSARVMADFVWSLNAPEPGGDATAEIRAARDADAASADRWHAAPPDERSDDEVAAHVLARLGLPR